MARRGFCTSSAHPLDRIRDSCGRICSEARSKFHDLVPGGTFSFAVTCFYRRSRHGTRHGR